MVFVGGGPSGLVVERRRRDASGDHADARWDGDAERGHDEHLGPRHVDRVSGGCVVSLTVRDGVMIRLSTH